MTPALRQQLWPCFAKTVPSAAQQCCQTSCTVKQPYCERRGATWWALKQQRALLAQHQSGGLQAVLHRRRVHETPRADGGAARRTALPSGLQQDATHSHPVSRGISTCVRRRAVGRGERVCLQPDSQAAQTGVQRVSEWQPVPLAHTDYATKGPCSHHMPLQQHLYQQPMRLSDLAPRYIVANGRPSVIATEICHAVNVKEVAMQVGSIGISVQQGASSHRQDRHSFKKQVVCHVSMAIQQAESSSAKPLTEGIVAAEGRLMTCYWLAGVLHGRG